MEQYTDLRIIDCNRLHSIESQGGNDENPAQFTNEIGAIRLDVGDSVAIQGAFVSEVGAGSDTIEMKGVNLLSSSGVPLTKTLYYTDETPSYPTHSWDERYDNIMGGFMQMNSQTNACTYILRDNSCKIETEYYTTNNGRGYLCLPRRFAYDKDYEGFNTSGLSSTVWSEIDQVSSGSDTGRSFFYPRTQTICDDDYQHYRDGLFQPTDGQYPRGHHIQKHNNKRFTILRRQGDTFYQRDLWNYEGGANASATFPTYRDPAWAKYDYYKAIVDIEITPGFNSPSDISNQITNQLKLANDPELYKIQDITGIVQPITTIQTTKTWKPFTCASYDYFGHGAFTEFNASTPGSANAVKYFSAYENIAVKRPDLFLLGRECNASEGHAIYNTGGLPLATRTTNTVQTSFRFLNASGLEHPHMKALSNLFKAQANYPELFEGQSFTDFLTNGSGVASINNSRFLHMNTYSSASQSSELGSDGYNGSSSGNSSDTFNLGSIPWFFYYDKSKEDVFTDGTDINELSYGFATKYYNTDFGFWGVEFHPELIGGLTEFQHSSWISNASGYVSADIPKLRECGWDYHFNAYSTVAILPFSGRIDRDYLNNTAWAIQNASATLTGLNGETTNISQNLTKTYIGADDPLFNFDSVSSRFNFSRLHTSERAGQENIQAGVSIEGGSLINPNANKEVYKINPRFNQYEYNPDLKPYLQSITGKASWIPGNNASSEIAFPIMSRQVEPSTIFDSNSGIYITDFGYNKEDFNRGLWATLGFTYNQFNNASSPSSNRQTRINDVNKNNLYLATTNCEVVSSNTLDYNVNPYGAVFYTNQLSAPYCIVGPDSATSRFLVNGVASTVGQEQTIPIFPPISEDVNSVKLTAINLPRKMARPYYLIRSNIIEQPKFIGHDKALMPVVGLCDKQYSGGDFYFGSDNAFVFRITKARTITSITTSIHDPDGTFSKCDNDSAVIYKITKNVIAQTDIMSSIMNKK